MTNEATSTGQPPDFSLVTVTLMKGLTYREADEPLWQSLLNLQAHVRDYVSRIGLELVLDEAEGFAFLRQRREVDDEAPLPRLVARRPLGYRVSLLLALLRRRLAEFDAKGGDARLVLSRDEIADLVRVFLRDAGDEARLSDRLDGDVNKVVELGFLQRMRGTDDRFEVRRILKAFVDAQWLSDFDQRLQGYREHADTGAENTR